MRSSQKVKVVALIATILALAAGSVMAQDRTDTERAERRARERAVVSVVGPQTSLWVSGSARLGVYPDTDQGSEADAEGARITGVVEGGPADEAGLREGDVIVSLNGRSVLEPLPDPLDERRLDRDESLPVQRLVATARKLEPGDEVEVVYLRNGERRTTTLTAEAVGARGFRMPMEDVERSLRQLRERDLVRPFMRGEEGPSTYRFFGTPGEPWTLHLRERGALGRCPGDHEGWSVLMEGCVAGLELVPLNRRLGEYFDAEQGVLVADVTEDSAIGLAPGDVILAIAGRQVDDPGDVTRILRSYDPGEKVSFSIVRQGQRRTVEGTVK